MDAALESLWQIVSAQYRGRKFSAHGPGHWRRVERNGLWIASYHHADETVVRLFALFHDCRRENEHIDPGHGRRGAELAAALRGSAYELSKDRFELLYFACAWHTDGEPHPDPTIGACWDADRLDLGRVGIRPDPAYMSTALGREIAASGDVKAYFRNLR